MSVSYGAADGDERYYVHVWHQPVWDWLVAHLYHRYDTIMFHLPGFSKVESWLWKRQNRRLGEDGFIIPWSNKQDLRCYYLTYRNRVEWLANEISRETYERLLV